MESAGLGHFFVGPVFLYRHIALRGVPDVHARDLAVLDLHRNCVWSILVEHMMAVAFYFVAKKFLAAMLMVSLGCSQGGSAHGEHAETDDAGSKKARYSIHVSISSVDVWQKPHTDGYPLATRHSAATNVSSVRFCEFMALSILL